MKCSPLFLKAFLIRATCVNRKLSNRAADRKGSVEQQNECVTVPGRVITGVFGDRGVRQNSGVSASLQACTRHRNGAIMEAVHSCETLV
jgi:hypothetical protein